MAERLGEEFEGFVVSVHPYGFFVELREWFIDGLVRAEALRDDRYRFIETKHILKGERHGRVFRVGQRLRVRVDRVNRFLLEVEFSLADEEVTAAATGRGATRPAPPEARRGAAAPRGRAAGERAGRAGRGRRARGRRG
jgi:ribonuclease R